MTTINITDSVHATHTASINPATNTIHVTPHPHGASSRPTPYTHLTSAFAALFLPEGYPDSVPSDYLAFQWWDTIQGLCSYVRGVLCSNALFTGVGVGSTTASALSATAAFVFKDLAGMLGSILFSYAQGAKLDADEKQWRLFADAMNNIGLALELASPAFPSLFMLLSCLGSIAHAITGVAGAATRAAMTHHFAQRNNAADIAAKECSQETAAVLVGMLLGLGVAHAAEGRPLVAWSTFLLLMVLHMVANVKAVRCLELTSVNRMRADIIVSDFVQSKGKHVPTPRQVAGREPLLPPPVAALVHFSTRLLSIRRSSHTPPITFGVSVSALQATTIIAGPGVQPHQAGVVSPRRSGRRRVGKAEKASHLSDQGLNGAPDPTHALLPYIIAQRPSKGKILVALQDGIQEVDVLQAYAYARLVGMGLGARLPWLLQNWENMLKKMHAAGWELDTLQLAPGQHRWCSTHDE